MPEDPTPRTPTAAGPRGPAAAPPRPGRRRLRRALIAVAVLGAGWVLLTRSFVTRWVGEAVLSSRLGVSVRADSITLSTDGRITATGLRVLSGRVGGEAGRFAWAETVVVRTPWWRAAWGWAVGTGPQIRSVEVDGLVVRVSQSVDDGSPNIPRFRIKASGGGGDLPTLEISRGRVELGEHGAAGFRALRTLEVTGRLSPGAREGEYGFDLRQPGAGPGGLALSGTLDQKRVRARLGGLVLDALTPETAPAPVRELFRKLDLSGRIADTTFEYALPGPDATTADMVRGIEASLALEEVAVTLPFEDLASQAPAGQRYPRLNAVSGTITVRGGELSARLKGKLEDLPYTVTMDWHGAALDAPFEAVVATEGFTLSTRPRLLPFLPPMVHKRLAMFSNPSGVVDSRVVLTRGRGGEEPRVSGTIQIKEGVASFIRFPYEFRKMEGLFEFDDNELRIVKVRGTAPTGAEITTTGRITPLTDEAAVSLDITVTNVPVDEKLAEGLGPRRRGVLDALFNREREAELIRAGLIVTPEESARRAKELAEARERLARLEARAGAPAAALAAARDEKARAESRASTPAFALGGRGNVHMTLTTPFGRDMPWTQEIEIEIPEAGLLPKRFALPIRARDVKLLVDDTVLSVRGGTFSALRGGEATVVANADFSSDGPAAKPGEPMKRETDITITATGIPFDDLLINAIPSKDRPVGTGTGADARTLGGVLHGLELRGAGDAKVWIGDVAPGEMGFDARVTFGGATCSPRTPTGEAPTLLEAVGGTIRVTDESLTLAVTGDVAPTPGERSSRESGGRLSVDLSAAFPGGGAPPTFESIVKAVGLDTRTPVERAIALFSPQAARTVAALRERYDPEGAADIQTLVKDDGKAPVRVEVGASNGRDVSITYVPTLPAGAPPAGPVRASMGPWGGSLLYKAGEPGVIAFRGLTAELAVQGRPAGALKLNGEVELVDGLDAGSLQVELAGARFESPLTRTVMAERLSPEFATFLHERNPRGEFDLTMKLDRPGARARGAAATPWEVDGVLTPSSLAVHGDTVDVDMPRAAGTVRFRRDGGRFDKIELRAPDWWASIDGGWSLAPDGSSALQATLGGRAAGLPATLMSLMPATVRDMAKALDAKAEGETAFQRVDLRLEWPGPGAKGSGPAPFFKVAGLLGFEKAAADLGVLITDAKGSVNFDASRDSLGKVEYHAVAGLETLRAAGVQMTDGRAVLNSGQNPGETLVPKAGAWCHGGPIEVEASIKPVDPSAPDGPKVFSTKVDVVGVRLAGVLNDFSAKKTDENASAVVEGNVTLGGIVGDPASRRGRGQLTAGGGSVLDMPVMLPLIQLSNFQIPSGEQLDLAKVDFYVDGSTAALERISVLSPNVELRGFGTVSWPNLDLNLVFNSRSNSRILLITKTLEWLRDNVVTTVVRGTAKDPKVSVDTFRNARKAFTGLLSEKSDLELIMWQLESRNNEPSDRRRVAPPPSSGGGK